MTITRDTAAGCNLDGATDAGEFRLLTLTGADVTVSNVTLSEGCADAPNAFGGPANGGAIMVSSGSLTLSNASVLGNRSSQSAGALAIRSGAVVRIENSEFANNVSDFGGVFYAVEEDVTIEGSTFSGNTASDFGGVAYLTSPGTGTVTITNSTFADNRAASGGAFYVYGGVLQIDQATLYLS